MAARPRLIVSAIAGLLVLCIVAWASFGSYRDAADYVFQKPTLRYLQKTKDAVDAYRQEHHVLPKSLDDLPWMSGVARDPSRKPADSWFHPLHYQTEGTRYRIASYGLDGKPGGVGLDYDLSDHDVSEDHNVVVYKLPPESRATFWQFLTANGLQWGGSGGMMALSSLLAGLAAFVLSFQVRGGNLKDPRRSISITFELIVTLGITVVVGFIIASVHVPSGH